MKKSDILNELRKIVPPHSGMNIVDLGIVKEINFQNKKIEVLLVPYDVICPMKYISSEIETTLKRLGFRNISIFLKIKNHIIRIV